MSAILAAILEICNLSWNIPFLENYIVTIEFMDPENLGVGTKIRMIDASKAEL